MVTLKHPAFSRITREVPPDDVPRWVASGWIDERPAVEVGSITCEIVPDLTGFHEAMTAKPKPGPKPKVKP